MTEEKKGPPQVVHVQQTISGGIGLPGQGAIRHEDSVREGFGAQPKMPEISEAEREMFKEELGITDPKLMEKIKEISFKALLHHNQRNLAIMNSKIKEAVKIERHRARHYLETVCTYLRVHHKETVSIQFIKGLADDLGKAKHHDERSGQQFVFIQDTLNVDDLGSAKQVKNTLVVEE